MTVTTDWWYRWYVIFTGILVAVGSIGAGLAYRTLRAIGHQEEAMHGQLTAMQAQLTVMEGQLTLAARQWVDAKKWTAAFQERERGARELVVGFDIINPTRLPLTVEMVETKSKNTAVAFKGRISLIPDGAYRFHTTFPLSEEAVRNFTESNDLTIPIQVTVCFSNELKRPQEQYFGGTLFYANDLNGEHVDFFPQAEMVARLVGEGTEKVEEGRQAN